jgi:hypothetical protein
MEPIKKLTIYREDKTDGYRELEVVIYHDGSLVLDGVDAGEDVINYFGDWDFEYLLVVAPEYKDTVLLHLIKDRFSSAQDMQQWLKERDIPYQFTSY